MSSARILVAAVAGGVAMFIWGAVSHMALGIGEIGVKHLPHDETLIPALKQSIDRRGFYFFPPMEDQTGMTPEQKKEAMAKFEEEYRAGPRGVLIYDPSGDEPISVGKLGVEGASNVLAALIAAVLLARVRGGRAARALLGAAIGVIAWLSIDASYWTWYRFPTEFASAQFLDQTIGWLVTGTVIALVLGSTQREPQPA